MAKNLCAKTRLNEPYEVWQRGSWTWEVLKKYQADDSKPYARWFCRVKTPHMPEGELGDVYAAEVMAHAVKVK